MLHVHRILVSAIVLAAGTAALTACGQKGPLFLPTDPGAAQRATLPQIINATLPYGTPVPEAAPPAPAASAPATPVAPSAPASAAR